MKLTDAINVAGSGRTLALVLDLLQEHGADLRDLPPALLLEHMDDDRLVGVVGEPAQVPTGFRRLDPA